MPTADAQQRYRIADLTLDLGQRKLWRGAAEIALTGRLFALLRALAESAPNVVTHDELADRVWGPRRVVTPENLSQHVALLRRALGDDAGSPRYIEAIRGAGYRLLVDVLPAATASGSLQRFVPAAAVLAIIAIAAFFVGRLVPQAGPETLPPGPLQAASVGQVEAIDPRSLIVLPFENVSADPDDPEQTYFVDGLSEELIYQLAQIEGAVLVGRTSSFALKGFTGDARAIRELVGVAYILEGSVRRSGGSLRIGSQLVRTSDGVSIWSNTYDRGIGDVLAIQREIAQSVAAQLGARLSAEALDDEFYGLGGTTDPQAYDRYLRAQGLIQAGGPVNLLRAEALLREVVAIDPGFVAGRAILAQTIGTLRFLQPTRSEALLREWNELMDSVVRAVPDHPAVHFARSLRLTNENDWIGAERSIRRVLEVAPPGRVRDEGKSFLTSVLRATGRFAEALEPTLAAADADPLSLERSSDLQEVLYATGRPDEAEREYVRSLDLQGNRLTVETNALMRAVVEGYDRPTIEERLSRLAASLPAEPTLFTELVRSLDDPEAALAILDRAEVPPISNVINPMLVAWWADYYGDTDRALVNLRRAFDLTSRINSSIWAPFLEKTRATPGFKALVEDYGLVEYWHETGNWSDFCGPIDDSDFECG